MSSSNHAIRASQARDQRTVYYTQKDVDVIRDQIIQGESMKRRWMVLGLILATAGLAITIALLSSSYSLYAGSKAETARLTQENAAIAQQSKETQQALDALKAREATQESSKAAAMALVQRLLPGGSANADIVPIQAAALAKAVHQVGGRVETESKPPDKLFRNWKVSAGSTTELYTVVGGFVGGKWVIYSNLVGRRQNAERASNQAND